MSNELTIYPKRGSNQANFENLMIRHFGMKLSVFALHGGGWYVNEHIQWMWEQYKRKLTRK